ncbi:MAG: hypothetical protein JW748_13510 [Anaerolineales bacterium]|nr:hypothetical protein [Anaerolineales bacterium]
MKSCQWVLFLTASVLGSACILEAVAGPTPTPQMIVIPGDGGDPTTPSSTPDSILSLTPTGTPTAQPTGTATINQVTMTAGQDLSCVTGPHWILYEWVTRIAEGEVVTLLAKAAPEWEEYYFVLKRSGTPASCWAFGGSSTISGNAAGLPVREAPPLPQVVYTVENKTFLGIGVVAIRGKDETSWGANLLSAPIPPGGKAHLTLTAGFYDVEFIDTIFRPVFEEQDRAIGSDPAYRYTILDHKHPFYVHNGCPFELCKFSFRVEGGSDWMVLHDTADGPVASGADLWLELLPGNYEVGVYDCYGMLLNSTFTNHYIGPAMQGFTVP